MKISDLKWNVKYNIEVLEDTDTMEKGKYENCSLALTTEHSADFLVDIDEDDFENAYEDCPDDAICAFDQDDLDKGIIILTEIE